MNAAELKGSRLETIDDGSPIEATADPVGRDGDAEAGGMSSHNKSLVDSGAGLGVGVNADTSRARLEGGTREGGRIVGMSAPDIFF